MDQSATTSCDGKRFVVTTTITETITSATTQRVVDVAAAKPMLTAVPVSDAQTTSTPAAATAVTTIDEIDGEQQPCCSSQAIVPLSSSLPSKLLRFHARRSTQALLQSQSVDSQFGSGSEFGESSDASATSPLALPAPSAPTLAELTPTSSLAAFGECGDDKLIDVGMGSSIGDSEESEEDDELKPLAVDNHMLNEVELGQATGQELLASSLQQQQPPSAILSEANLRKHHSHHYMDNIYLHPNFKYELSEQVVALEGVPSMPEAAVMMANTVSPAATTPPTEVKPHVHRSFLTMKKAPAESAPSEADTNASSKGAAVNEIDTLDPALIPSDELSVEIAEAVEYYFSNECILKDAFLLKHVRRNKDGFVSLKLVSSFKRVRQLTKEWKVVGHAIRRKSQKIELNELGTKVRRLEPLPNFDETMPSRTIVVSDLPLDKLSIEKVSDIFSKCGEIALIRILKPGMAIPVDVRQFMNKYPEMQQKECALVEYLESTSARDAKNLEGPFQVFDMVAPKKKTGKKAIIQVTAPVTRMVENLRYYNDASYERTRGGSFSGMVPQDINLRYVKLKRNNSDFHARQIGGEYPTASPPHHHHQQHYQPQLYSPPATYSNHYGSGMHAHGHYAPPTTAGMLSSPTGNGTVYFNNSPRRYSNASTVSAHKLSSAPCAEAASNSKPMVCNKVIEVSSLQRRLSNCSDTNNSALGEHSRRSSNCSEHLPQRRESNCSENCPCSRRVSDFGQSETQRKASFCSNGSCEERRFSNGSMQFERSFSNASELNGFHRRMSNDFNLENRKHSIETQTSYTYDPEMGGGSYNSINNNNNNNTNTNAFPRRYSNNFNPGSKLAAYENAQYINGRRISTDSGYDRRCSFGSEYEGSPRSRTGSFLSSYKHIGSGGGDYDAQPRSRTGSFLDGSPRSRSGSFAQRAAESLVRTPIGPDGSKGFGTRARKYGQTISPVN